MHTTAASGKRKRAYWHAGVGEEGRESGKEQEGYQKEEACKGRCGWKKEED